MLASAGMSESVSEMAPDPGAAGQRVDRLAGWRRGTGLFTGASLLLYAVAVITAPIDGIVIARQVDEGGVQIGATNEEVGHDDRVTQPGLSDLAAEAVAAYPALGKAQLVRSWGALRVLSPDGLPIYQESREMPGAYLVTCHSGITLSAAHARFLPDWLEGTAAAPDLEVFSESRFAVS